MCCFFSCRCCCRCSSLWASSSPTHQRAGCEPPGSTIADPQRAVAWQGPVIEGAHIRHTAAAAAAAVHSSPCLICASRVSTPSSRAVSSMGHCSAATTAVAATVCTSEPFYFMGLVSADAPRQSCQSQCGSQQRSDCCRHHGSCNGGGGGPISWLVRWGGLQVATSALTCQGGGRHSFGRGFVIILGILCDLGCGCVAVHGAAAVACKQCFSCGLLFL
jgi:hypothetical protein